VVLPSRRHSRKMQCYRLTRICAGCRWPIGVCDDRPGNAASRSVLKDVRRRSTGHCTWANGDTIDRVRLRRDRSTCHHRSGCQIDGNQSRYSTGREVQNTPYSNRPGYQSRQTPVALTPSAPIVNNCPPFGDGVPSTPPMRISVSRPESMRTKS